MSLEEGCWCADKNSAAEPAMYRYLLITRNRDAFLIEEPGGHLLHLMRQLFKLMKAWFPEVIYTRFKGRIVPEDCAQLDLIVVLPVRPVPGLLGLLLEGLGAVLLSQGGPGIRLSIPRHAFQIELGSRSGTQGLITSGENRFETATKALVALLLLDEIQTEWVRGTSSRRTSRKRRMAFFIDRPGDADSGIGRGRLLRRHKPLAE